MSKELAHYLQQLALEGDTESHGAFSVDYTKALEKLSARLFSDRSSYLLKLVQAAIASGASEVDVRTHKDRLEVHFASARFTSQQMMDLTGLLHEPLGTAQDPAMAHFLRAMHAARSNKPLSLAWAVRDQEGGVGHVFHGEELHTVAMDPRPGAGAECVFSLRTAPRQGHRLGGCWVEEQQALQSRCLLSPKPIRWDSRQLNPGIPKLSSMCLLDRIFLSQEPGRSLLALPHLTQLTAAVYDLGHGYEDHYSYGATLLQQWRCYRPRAGHSLFPLSSVPDFQMIESDVVQELFGIPADCYAVNHGAIRPGRLQGSNNGYQILYVHDLAAYTHTPFAHTQGRFGKRTSLCAQAWLRCPSEPTGPNQLYLLQDGVLLDPVEIELGLAGAQVFVADGQVKTDLSGLCPIHDERLQAMQLWLKEEAERSKKELRKTLRWGDKYGLSQAWIQRVNEVHQLEQDD